MRDSIKALKKKKPKAQQRLFNHYADYLYRICYRYVKSKEKAEDLLSQTFLTIFDKVDQTDITEEYALRAWMKKIAINQCLMELRKKIQFPPTLELIECTEESGISSDQNLLEKDLIQLVLSLPDGYRTVFSLYVIEGYKHEEIAQKLQISVGTSKSQLNKARKLLKEKITQTEIHYETAR